jgi:hypothetical protein
MITGCGEMIVVQIKDKSEAIKVLIADCLLCSVLLRVLCVKYIFLTECTGVISEFTE